MNKHLDQHLITALRRNAALGVITSILLLSACSTTHSSPFFMYSSPLLDGDMRAQRTPDNSFDPVDSSNTPSSNRHYVLDHTSTSARTNPRQAHTYLANTKQPAANEPIPKKPNALPAHALASTKTASAALNHSATLRSGNSGSAHAADYAWSMYALNKTELPDDARTSIPAMYRACRDSGEIFHHNNPRVGDLAFFHNTIDANQDGRNNDWYTHVAIVEEISPSATIALLGYQNGQVQRFYMNLRQIDSSHAPDQTILNTALRTQTKSDAPFTQYLSSQLFAGFCSLLGQQSELNIVDNWQPGMILRP